MENQDKLEQLRELIPQLFNLDWRSQKALDNALYLSGFHGTHTLIAKEVYVNDDDTYGKIEIRDPISGTVLKNIIVSESTSKPSLKLLSRYVYYRSKKLEKLVSSELVFNLCENAEFLVANLPHKIKTIYTPEDSPKWVQENLKIYSRNIIQGEFLSTIIESNNKFFEGRFGTLVLEGNNLKENFERSIMFLQDNNCSVLMELSLEDLSYILGIVRGIKPYSVILTESPIQGKIIVGLN